MLNYLKPQRNRNILVQISIITHCSKWHNETRTVHKISGLAEKKQLENKFWFVVLLSFLAHCLYFGSPYQRPSKYSTTPKKHWMILYTKTSDIIYLLLNPMVTCVLFNSLSWPRDYKWIIQTYINRDPFLTSPGKLTGPKPCFKIKINRIENNGILERRFWHPNQFNLFL